MTKSKTITILAAVILLLAGLSASGQTPPKTQTIITWQARNFYPSDYRGKAPATAFSPVAVAVEVIKGGKLLDLSNADLVWYLDDRTLASGRGLKETGFSVTRLPGDSHSVRVRITTPTDTLDSSVTIPVDDKKVAIEVPYAANIVPAESRITLRAFPYFFNMPSLENLTFSWEVNGEVAGGGNDNQITIALGTPQIASQQNLQVSVIAQNSRNQLEFTSAKVKLLIQ